MSAPPRVMRRFRKIFLVLFALCALPFVLGALLPQHYEVQRKVLIRAPAERVFPWIGDLARWPQWEPFSADDPTLVTTLGERTSGVGASQSWVGQASRGRLVFTASDPARGVEFDVVFTNGEHESPAHSWMLFTPVEGGESVELSWGMRGELNMPIVGGYLALFADRRFLGPMMERGQGRLRDLAEAAAAR
jgi:uncharacterized protein YndB with AHSA1/START domain